MLIVLPFVNVVLLMLALYVASFVTVGWLATRKGQYVLPESRLRTEIRDSLSTLLLDMVEQDDDLTLLGLIDRCPPKFQSGRAWEIWTQESHLMAMNLLYGDRS